MKVDKYTEEQAKEYANNEAELLGFKVGSPKWKSCFKEYIDFALTTMTVGRNPRNIRNPSLTSIKPIFVDMFSPSGISGELAKNYSGEKTTPEAIEQRIMSAVTNLVKLFEAGRLRNKVSTKGNYGEVANDQMTNFQLPKRHTGMSDEAYKLQTNKVLKNWVTRDLLTAVLIETLTPFFMLEQSDIDEVFKRVGLEKGTIQAYQQGGRDGDRYKMMKWIYANLSAKRMQLNLKKLLFD